MLDQVHSHASSVRSIPVRGFRALVGSGSKFQQLPRPPSGLVSWWPGDSDENDVVGGNNPSAINAVTLVPAEVGNGFTFGNQGYIQIPQAESLMNLQFTWLAWAR